jgi:F420H(2)-dependent quinone reductase
MLLLDHVGARSGRRRTTPLLDMPDGDNLVVVTAKGGHPRHPGWVHNLRARPDAEVQVGGRRMRVQAREARDEEARPAVAEGPPRTTPSVRAASGAPSGRFPLVVLEPRPG